MEEERGEEWNIKFLSCTLFETKILYHKKALSYCFLNTLFESTVYDLKEVNGLSKLKFLNIIYF